MSAPKWYYIKTILLLDMAYNNARLIGPVKSSWLVPDPGVWRWVAPPLLSVAQIEQANAADTTDSDGWKTQRPRKRANQ